MCKPTSDNKSQPKTLFPNNAEYSILHMINLGLGEKTRKTNSTYRMSLPRLKVLEDFELWLDMLKVQVPYFHLGKSDSQTLMPLKSSRQPTKHSLINRLQTHKTELPQHLKQSIQMWKRAINARLSVLNTPESA